MSDSWDSNPPEASHSASGTPLPDSLPHAVAPQSRPSATPWIVLSIIQTLCCFNFLFGIAGFVLSLQGKAKADQNDINGAKAKLNTAKIVILIGFVLSFIAMIALTIAVVTRSGDVVNSAVEDVEKNFSGENPVATVGLNEAGKDGALEFTTKSVTCGTATVGSEFSLTTSQGQYCLADVTIKNVGNSVTAFDPGAQKLQDSASNSHDSDTSATISANASNTNFVGTPINPGNTASGTIAFDIPVDAEAESLVLREHILSRGVKVTLK